MSFGSLVGLLKLELYEVSSPHGECRWVYWCPCVGGYEETSYDSLICVVVREGSWA